MTTIASLTYTLNSLSFLPISTFSRFDCINDSLEWDWNAACVLDELINDLLLGFLLCQDVYHGLLEVLSFLLHLKTDLEALDFRFRSDSCIEFLISAAHTYEQMVVFNYEWADFRANQILVWLKFNDRQDQTKALLKFWIREKVDEVLESFLLRAHSGVPLARVWMFIHQFQVICRSTVLENPGPVHMLPLH